jgi:predicted Zn-ribbon and HTH transcriptional regulator
MTIQEKLNRKGYNLVASYNNGQRVGYFASSRNYNEKTKSYKTKSEVLNAIKK